MTDAVLSLRPGRVIGAHAHGLELDGQALADLLEDTSWSMLARAVEAVRDTGAPGGEPSLVLFTRDGRTLEAEVFPRLDAVAIELHDVSRHVDEADRFARMALQLHRRNRDLQTLYDATTALGETLDVQALVSTTAEVLGAYLDPVTVIVTAAGHEAHWGRQTAEVGPELDVTARALATARGDIGTAAWWRPDGLAEDEARVVDVVLRKAAVSIDHALLLAPLPSDAEHDELGLLTAPAARRALAGFVRPFAVALIGSKRGTQDLASLVDRVREGRAGDVKAQWGSGRVLVALAGAGVPELRAWLERVGLGHASETGSGSWTVGLAPVDRDVDAAIGKAATALEHARASGQAIVET